MRSLPLVLCFSALSVAAPAPADTVTLAPAKDNTLYQDSNGALSNGLGGNIFSGRTAQGETRRAVLAFDLSPIPPGSTVQAASLSLTVTRSRSGTRTHSLHRLLADWGEGASDAGLPGGAGAASQPGDATWIHRFYSTTFWATPGGSFNSAASASAAVGNAGSLTWSASGVAADVLGWVNNPASNFGWLVRGDESTSTTAKGFASREATDPNQRPRLVVTFTPPPGYGGCCMPSGECRTMLPAPCADAGGTFQGEGVSCTPNPCPQPQGACCFADASCQQLTQADCAAAGGSFQGAFVSCEQAACPRVLTPFVDQLPRPAVAQPVTGQVGGEALYRMVISEFPQQLHRDLPPTTVWGFNGAYPGPTIEAATGLPVTVEWVNDIRDPEGNLRQSHYLPVDLCLDGPDVLGDSPRTVMHMHGAKVHWESDGYPEATILPGQEVTYYYPNQQDASTLWYHDHSLGITRLNVYMGLAGLYTLRDPAENALGLPAGEFEIPLVIQDRRFNPDGSLRYPEMWEDHFFGDTVLVNGKVWPYLEVKRGKYRFRIVNGSTSRTYTLALSNGTPIVVIGSDQGLIAAPVFVNEITLTPGERLDVVIDFAPISAGTHVILTNSAPAHFPGTPGDGVVANVMKFITLPESGHTAPLPPALRSVPRVPDSQARVTRDMVLRQFPDPDCGGTIWLINAGHWRHIEDRPRLNSTEVWRFINQSSVAHPMHIHLVRFQVLDRQAFTINDGVVVPAGARIPPHPLEAGWKDTVAAYPGEITRVIARFEGYTGFYPFHCHILEHEDHDMMRQFEVIPECICDINSDQIIDSRDYFSFINAFFGGNADINRDGVTNTQDFFDFINCFFAGCP